MSTIAMIINVCRRNCLAQGDKLDRLPITYELMLSANIVIGELSWLRCNDVNCENSIHLYEIKLLCSMLIDICITAVSQRMGDQTLSS